MDELIRHNAQVPDGWEVVRLKDVLVLDQPGTWGNETTSDDPGVRVLRAADLTRDGRIELDNVVWRLLSERDRKRRLMKDGDLILERSGGGPGTPVGRVALIDGYGPVYCSNFCQQLRVDRARCNPRYAARALWHRYVCGVTARLEHQTTGIRNLDYASYLAFPILLPPLAEQRAIAAVLDSIDEAIECTEAVIAATERLRDALLHELLTRGVPGWHSEWKDAPGIGTIPVCWEVVRLGDVCNSPQYGAGAPAIPFDPSLPRYVRITDITDDGRLRPDDARSADPAQAIGYELQAGDLLFARSGATVGKAYLYQLSDGPCVYAGYLIRFQAMLGLAKAEYLWWFTQSRYYRAWVDSMFRAGAQPNINAQEYASMTVPYPPLEEQQAIVALLDRVAQSTERGREEHDVLQLLRTAASDALLTGFVRVSV